jgi:hypothetical protein
VISFLADIGILVIGADPKFSECRHPGRKKLDGIG